MFIFTSEQFRKAQPCPCSTEPTSGLIELLTAVGDCGRSGQGDVGSHTDCVAHLCLRISWCSQKNSRNVPQSDPMAPAQLRGCAVTGSSGGQLSENRLHYTLSLHARIQLSCTCHLLFSHRLKTTFLHNGTLLGWGGPGSEDAIMTCRWEMLHFVPSQVTGLWKVHAWLRCITCFRNSSDQSLSMACPCVCIDGHKTWRKSFSTVR